MTDTTALELEVRSVSEAIEEFERRLATFQPRDDEPVADQRSAAQIIMALASGDEDTQRYYNTLLEERAYTGGTSADSTVEDAWVGDLTRIFDSSTGILSAIFAQDTLPNGGLNLEWAQLKSNTVKFEEVENEGDDLEFGKVTLENKTTPVKTYGGYTQLTRKMIERSTLPILNRNLEALAMAAGARAKVDLRAGYDALYAERLALAANAGAVPLGATLAAGTYAQWSNAIIDAFVKFEQESLELEHLVVSVSVFKKFNSFLDSTGRPLFDKSGDGTNSVGTLRLKGLGGDLEGVHVVADTGATGDKAGFVNGRAIRHYKSGLVQLQDENIINLSKDFSAYRYGAVAAEIPAGLVPVKFGA